MGWLESFLWALGYRGCPEWFSIGLWGDHGRWQEQEANKDGGWAIDSALVGWHLNSAVWTDLCTLSAHWLTLEGAVCRVSGPPNVKASEKSLQILHTSHTSSVAHGDKHKTGTMAHPRTPTWRLLLAWKGPPTPQKPIFPVAIPEARTAASLQGPHSVLDSHTQGSSRPMAPSRLLPILQSQRPCSNQVSVTSAKQPISTVVTQPLSSFQDSEFTWRDRILHHTGRLFSSLSTPILQDG